MQTKLTNGVETLVAEAEPECNCRKQVGILGGNFNPVHNTHLLIADQVGHALGLDQVLLMPEFLPPHVDEKKTIAASDRLAMLEAAVSDNQLLGIEKAELERKGRSFTYDTMKALKAQHPDTAYYFIIGGDMVAYLPKWYKIDELLQLVQFVGVRRPGYPDTSAFPIIWVDVPLMDLSSTTIRKKVAQGCSIRYYVPEAVREYIIEKGLYLDEI